MRKGDKHNNWRERIERKKEEREGEDEEWNRVV